MSAIPENECEDTVERVCEIKAILASLPPNPAFAAIAAAIDAYLLANCAHVIERDYVDISPERGVYITYCSRCECTIQDHPLSLRTVAAAAADQSALGLVEAEVPSGVH
jgi:hypothetical protein